MNCNKCGTPILPGENTCRFCGSVDNFSARKGKEKTPEIIGFDIEEKIEIIDFSLSEDEVAINPEPREEEIIEDDIEVDEIINDEVIIIEEEDLEDEKGLFVNSIIEEPPTARIPVEEVKKQLEEELEEIPSIEPELPVAALVENDESNEEKPEELIKINEEEVKEKKNTNISVIILAVLLILSVILNCFLLMGTGNAYQEAKELETSSENLKTVYNSYELEIPNNWKTNNSNDEYLLVYDESNEWALSLNLIDDLDFNKLETKKEEIISELGNLQYLFTSDYTKTINDKKFHIFKGKYDSYAVYVIINELDEKKISVTDLKFTGEVKEDILEETLESLSLLKKVEDKILSKEKFTFNNITSIFEDNLKK